MQLKVKLGSRNVRRILLLAVMLGGAASVGILIAQQQAGGNSASALNPATNRVPDVSGLEALRRIEGQINRALGGGARKSLEGLMAPPTPTTTLPPPPQRVVQPTRRTLEDLDKRKNWMFQDPNDLNKDKEGDKNGSQDSILGDPEGVKLTPMERYYQKLGGTIPGMEEPKTRRDSENRQLGTREEELPGNLGTTAKELRKLLQDRDEDISFAGGSQRKEASLFGLGEVSPVNPGLKAAPNPVIEQYRSFLQEVGRSPSMASGTSIGSPLGAMEGVGGVTSARDALANQVNNLTPLASPTLPDLNANALNNWNPMYTPPLPVTPKAPSAPAPVSFDAPRRKFN